MPKRYSLFIATLAILSPATVRGDDPAKPRPNSDKEPMAERFSLERGARFLDVRFRSAGDFHCGGLHDAVGRQKFRWSQKILQIGGVFFGCFAGRGEINYIVLSRNPGCEGENWSDTGRIFCGDHAECIGLDFKHFRCAALRLVPCRECFLKGRFRNERCRQPNASRP